MTLAIHSGTLRYRASDTAVCTSPMAMADSPLRNQASFMNSMVRGICVALLLAALTQVGTAQEIPKSEYIEYEPLASPRIVGQTRASAAWHLFGDPADSPSRTCTPRDRITDNPHTLLPGLPL